MWILLQKLQMQNVRYFCSFETEKRLQLIFCPFIKVNITCAQGGSRIKNPTTLAVYQVSYVD